jgi:predicted permease
MESILQDVRYAFRMLTKSPGFTAVAVLTLALGIGANTAIFTLINAVILKMLPVRDVQRLVVIGDPTQAHSRSHGTPQNDVFSYPLYREFRDHNDVFEGVFAAGEMHRVRTTKASGESIADDVLGVLVTGNYFSVLGVNPLMGRVLSEQDDKVAGGHPVAVISYSMFQNRFNADASVLGSTIRLNEYPFTVVGVAPPGFHGQVVGDVQEVWIPLMMQPQVMRGRDWLEDPESSWLTVMARLKPGVSVAQAKADVNVVWKQALAGSFGAKLDPDDLRQIQKQSIEVTSGAHGLSVVRGNFAGPLMLLMGIVGLVLLIACVNVANLLLARANARQKEIAVRLAMGAKPSRLVRQLLTESVLLAFLGGALGLLLAFWGTRILLTISGLSVASTGLQVEPDFRVLAFTAGVCLLTGFLFGLVPAFRSLNVELNATLKSGTSGNIGTGRRFNWGKLLVASQVALSVLVLFAAGLLLRSLRNLQNVDLGYSSERLLMVRVDPITAGVKTSEASVRFTKDLRERLSHLAGVQQVAVSELGLFSGSDGSTTVKVENFTPASDEERMAAVDRVGPGFFSVLGIPVVMGREIGEQDTANSQRVAMVTESFQKFYFHGENPIGRRIWIDDAEHHDKPMEVVGVVKDSRDTNLTKPLAPHYYMALTQLEEPSGMLQFELKTVADPGTLADTVRREIKTYNPSLPIISVKTLDGLVKSTISSEIIIAKLSSFFGVLALVLASIGLYGVMSYTITGRTKEIGVRMALGAQRGNVLTLVMREAMLLVVIGIAAGIPLAMVTTRLINSMLFGLQNTDPLSLAIVVVILAAVGALASMIPARRATKVDPMVALRYE